jgi:hypothetical protein
LSPAEIKQYDAFPYKPLAHPLQSTAHMLFPKMWVDVHPEHSRIDLDFDFPDAYLPEYPPPLFLTTHKAQCASCHYGPSFADDYMHDLQVERFYKGRPEGPVKTFGLRGIKDFPPYLHDGRCPTPHDAVEFFNQVLELKLNQQEKEDVVAYMLCL